MVIADWLASKGNKSSEHWLVIVVSRTTRFLLTTRFHLILALED